MQKFIKIVAVSALVITGSTAAHAGGQFAEPSRGPVRLGKLF